MGAGKFTLENGRQVIDKDADDILYYGVNVADALPAGVTIATAIEAAALGRSPLSATPVGVELEQGVFAQDTNALALVRGGVSGGIANNYVRFRIPLSTGEQIDRTIYFNIKEN